MIGPLSDPRAHGGDPADADHVIGVHVNFLMTNPTGTPGELDDISPDDRAKLKQNRLIEADGQGYLALRATRPQTIGFTPADSPAGQLAWIAEKFKEWTDGTHLPECAIDRGLMLTDVMLYWLTNTAASSARLYYEVSHPPKQPERSPAPLGVAHSC